MPCALYRHFDKDTPRAHWRADWTPVLGIIRVFRLVLRRGPNCGQLLLGFPDGSRQFIGVLVRCGRFPTFAPCRIMESYRYPRERERHFDNGTLKVPQDITRYIERQPRPVAGSPKRTQRV